MIGSGYWSVGIEVVWRYAGGGDWGWAAKADFLDGGFCNDSADDGAVSTEGTIRTRYAVREGSTADALTVVIDVLKADAERLGITWNDGATVYYASDGEDEEYPPPDDWRELLGQQADRLGWKRLYGASPSALVPADPKENG